MSFKCYFNFHDYIPIDGLYWRYKYKEYSNYSPNLIGIETIKLYKCSHCNKVVEETVEFYPCIPYYSRGFKINDLISSFKESGIKHVETYYAK